MVRTDICCHTSVRSQVIPREGADCRLSLSIHIPSLVFLELSIGQTSQEDNRAGVLLSIESTLSTPLSPMVPEAGFYPMDYGSALATLSLLSLLGGPSLHHCLCSSFPSHPPKSCLSIFPAISLSVSCMALFLVPLRLEPAVPFLEKQPGLGSQRTRRESREHKASGG